MRYSQIMKNQSDYFVSPVTVREGVNEGVWPVDPCPAAAPTLRALPNPSLSASYERGVGEQRSGSGTGIKNERQSEQK